MPVHDRTLQTLNQMLSGRAERGRGRREDTMRLMALDDQLRQSEFDRKMGLRKMELDMIGMRIQDSMTRSEIQSKDWERHQQEVGEIRSLLQTGVAQHERFVDLAIKEQTSATEIERNVLHQQQLAKQMQSQTKMQWRGQYIADFREGKPTGAHDEQGRPVLGPGTVTKLIPALESVWKKTAEGSGLSRDGYLDNFLDRAKGFYDSLGLQEIGVKDGMQLATDIVIADQFAGAMRRERSRDLRQTFDAWDSAMGTRNVSVLQDALIGVLGRVSFKDGGNGVVFNEHRAPTPVVRAPSRPSTAGSSLTREGFGVRQQAPTGQQREAAERRHESDLQAFSENLRSSIDKRFRIAKMHLSFLSGMNIPETMEEYLAAGDAVSTADESLDRTRSMVTRAQNTVQRLQRANIGQWEHTPENYRRAARMLRSGMFGADEIGDTGPLALGAGTGISPAVLDTLSKYEGGISERAHWPGSDSGVTVGFQVDLGQLNEKRLRDVWGVSEETVSIVEPYLGKKGTAARDFLKKNPLDLSERPDVVAELSNASLRVHWQELEGLVQRDWGESLDELPEEAQSVLLSLMYQYGGSIFRRENKARRKLRVGKAIEWIFQGHFKGAAAVLRGLDDPRFKARRSKEADDLERI